MLKYDPIGIFGHIFDPFGRYVQPWLPTSMSTNRAAKNIRVAHSTLCMILSTSWISDRTRSAMADMMAIQPAIT